MASITGTRIRPGKTPFPRASDMTVLLGPAERPAGDGRRLCVVDPTTMAAAVPVGHEIRYATPADPSPVVTETRKSRPRNLGSRDLSRVAPWGWPVGNTGPWGSVH